MTPKEKADELYNKYLQSHIAITFGSARIAALICVEEILSLKMIDNMSRGFDSEMGEGEFWRQVKKEIQKL
jgi:hypothetical protein